jgi:hypothetical protein
LIERVHHILTKDARNSNEIESLAKIFTPLQQNSTEIIFNEQNKLIQELKNKCNLYEIELKKSHDSNECKNALFILLLLKYCI